MSVFQTYLQLGFLHICTPRAADHLTFLLALCAPYVLADWRRQIITRWDYRSVEQRRNFVRWPILTTWVWPNRVVPGSYDGDMAALQEWLSSRISWMDEQLKP